jgi:hypothetical protein
LNEQNKKTSTHAVMGAEAALTAEERLDDQTRLVGQLEQESLVMQRHNSSSAAPPLAAPESASAEAAERSVFTANQIQIHSLLS